MDGYLSRLLARESGTAPTLTPVVHSRFEHRPESMFTPIPEDHDGETGEVPVAGRSPVLAAVASPLQPISAGTVDEPAPVSASSVDDLPRAAAETHPRAGTAEPAGRRDPARIEHATNADGPIEATPNLPTVSTPGSPGDTRPPDATRHPDAGPPTDQPGTTHRPAPSRPVPPISDDTPGASAGAARRAADGTTPAGRPAPLGAHADDPTSARRPAPLGARSDDTTPARRPASNGAHAGDGAPDVGTDRTDGTDVPPASPRPSSGERTPEPRTAAGDPSVVAHRHASGDTVAPHSQPLPATAEPSGPPVDDPHRGDRAPNERQRAIAASTSGESTRRTPSAPEPADDGGATSFPAIAGSIERPRGPVPSKPATAAVAHDAEPPELPESPERPQAPVPPPDAETISDVAHPRRHVAASQPTTDRPPGTVASRHVDPGVAAAEPEPVATDRNRHSRAPVSDAPDREPAAVDAATHTASRGDAPSVGAATPSHEAPRTTTPAEPGATRGVAAAQVSPANADTAGGPSSSPPHDTDEREQTPRWRAGPMHGDEGAHGRGPTDTAEPPAPGLTISIGRIDARHASDGGGSQESTPARPRPTLSLGDYLQRRGSGR